ncbi:anti-sigma factor [Prevotella herbatica]|uniref:Anti-sigma factor n=1 Tax=Prevotella herbatica TaxID=2801997 RepID=A0ABN6EJP1_9BACT|nr:FecR domain-containing protein [Prevotella herbatica]BCS85354.1 anti-sigma factor [Prevotella herbatica]
MKDQYPHIDEIAIAKYLSGEANAIEIKALMDWVESSDENLEEFIRYEKLWFESSVHKPFNAQKAWSKVNRRISQKKRRFNLYYLTAAAAAIIIIIVVSVPFFNTKTAASSPEFAVASANSTLLSTLPDGSSALLSKHSKIEYTFDTQKQIRLTKLSGKAFFNVKRDIKHRFIVEANRGGVEVLGTKFSVDEMKNKDVKVYVLSGRVKVFLARAHKDTLSLIITNGEKAVIKASSDTIIKQTKKTLVFHSTNQIFKVHKTITFNNKDLSTIVAKLERSYSANIKIDDAVDKELRFSSSFKDNSLNEILTVITQTLNLDYTKKGNVYYITNGNDE